MSSTTFQGVDVSAPWHEPALAAPATALPALPGISAQCAADFAALYTAEVPPWAAL